MPILEKNGRRVYFAHIPKTAGTSIYIAFAASGWSIYNLEKGKTTRALQNKFGIKCVEQQGNRLFYPHPIQHAPKLIWKTWGPFSESFCVVRHPEERLKSALKHYYQGTEQKISFDDFTLKILQKLRNPLQRPVASWKMLHGHLIPQTFFATKDTSVHYFERDWKSEISDKFSLKLEDFETVNKSRPQKVTFSPEEKKLVKKMYVSDFKRFDY